MKASTLLKPLADMTKDPFVIATNHDLRLLSKSWVIPDFAFGKKILGSSTQYAIVFECAWSQAPGDLEKKLKKYKEDPDILAIICFVIKGFKNFQMPSDRPPIDHRIISSAFPESALKKRTLLSAVEYLGHNWGQIDDISLTIYYQEGEKSGRKDTFVSSLGFSNAPIGSDAACRTLLLLLEGRLTTTACSRSSRRSM